MKNGDKIIWDSYFGYDIGYFVEESDTQHDAYRCDMRTGVVIGLNTYPKSQVHPYTDEKLAEMKKKYGYTKEFSKIF